MSIGQSIGSSLGRAIGSSLSAGQSVNAFSAAKKLIADDAGDVSILFLGDSTGDNTTEWVYLFGQWLAAQYPTHSVDYLQWNNSTNVYAAAVSLGTGSGANTINVYNAHVGGTNPVSLMLSAKYAPAITAVNPAVVVWSYGHNLTSGDTYFVESLDSAYSPWMERVQADLPTATHALMTQNPNRDDDAYAGRYTKWLAMAADKGGLTVCNSYAQFVAQAKAGALYSDNVHPSATGTLLYRDAIALQWTSASQSSAASTAAWLSATANNLLLNGDFADWAGAVPASWTAGGGSTITKELAIVDGADPWSLKIEQTGATADVRQTLSAGNLAIAKAAGAVAFALRLYVPTGSTYTGGHVLFEVTAGGTTYRKFYATSTFVVDSWYWMFLRDIIIPSNTTQIRVLFYANTTNTPGAVAYFARATCVAGNLPRDMS